MHRTRRSLTVAAALLGLATTTLASRPLAAQEPPGETSADPALVSIGVDVLKAESTDVGATLAEIRQNVASQRDALSAAQDTLSAAKAALAAADTAVTETESKLAKINADSDLVVVDAFLSPPNENAWESLSAGSLMDLTVKQSLLDREADLDAATLDQYGALRDQLETQRSTQKKAAAAAEAAATDAQGAYDDLEAASSQQARFAVEVDRRLNRNLAEAANLEDTDPELAKKIREREAQLADALEALDDEVQAQRSQANSAQLAALRAGVPGGVTSVACPSGGSISLAGDLAAQVERLLTDASEAGIGVCGSGYRDPGEQVALRRAHCGSSYYAIYQAPSSACSPPTAPPGSSMHEQGLAIDFTSGGSTLGYSSSGYTWLKANAVNYGLYNLPGEPWHWSVNGD